MKKLLSVILTIIIMVLVIYVPYALSVRVCPFSPPPDSTEGVIWHAITSVEYYIVNWFTGLTIFAFAVIGLIIVLVVGKGVYHLAQSIYRGTLELLEAMEVKQ